MKNWHQLVNWILHQLHYCTPTVHDWLKKHSLHFFIQSELKPKPNRHSCLYVFLRFKSAKCYYFEFSLVYFMACVFVHVTGYSDNLIVGFMTLIENHYNSNKLLFIIINFFNKQFQLNVKNFKQSEIVLVLFMCHPYTPFRFKAKSEHWSVINYHWFILLFKPLWLVMLEQFSI